MAHVPSTENHPFCWHILDPFSTLVPLSLCFCAENATSSMSLPLFFRPNRSLLGLCSHGMLFSLSPGPLALLTCVSLIGGKLCGGRNSVSFTFVKSPGASVVAATVLELMNIWQVIECMLWVKPQSVLPESRTPSLPAEAFAESQVTLEGNTSCSPLLAVDSHPDVNVLCGIVGVSSWTEQPH